MPQAFDELAAFVDDNVEHNGRPFGLSGYRDMLMKDFADIPDLRFEAEVLGSCHRHQTWKRNESRPASAFSGHPRSS
ncbi:ester cyclase [Agrobacterium sp. V1]|uniref:ester cyclase n=1 Tax=Agrobacterium sp. V1 TaxID=3061957 RepID=UPI002671C6A9|nr:ester cyclase [Agrobacterium sp. V1]MDO3445262.1 ester cyclase [Agrobacterium sp. V1]